MTDDRIFYPTSDGGIAVVIPTGELPLEEVALKDVPAGTPYLIGTVTDQPADRDFRNAWEADFSSPDGTGIGADAWFEAHPPEPERRPGPPEGYVPTPEPEPEPMPMGPEPEPLPVGPPMQQP